MTGSSSNQLHRSRRPADIAPLAGCERTSHARAVERATAATAGQTLSEEARQTIETTEDRISTTAARLREKLGSESADALGAALRTPFTNARAVKFWDIDSIDRWLQRHADHDVPSEME